MCISYITWRCATSIDAPACAVTTLTCVQASAAAETHVVSRGILFDSGRPNGMRLLITRRRWYVANATDMSICVCVWSLGAIKCERLHYNWLFTRYQYCAHSLKPSDEANEDAMSRHLACIIYVEYVELEVSRSESMDIYVFFNCFCCPQLRLARKCSQERFIFCITIYT